MEDREKRASDEWYLALNLCIGAAAIGFLALRLLHVDLRRLMLPCLFHYVTGLYCPGCGGTRALIALSRLHLMQSLRCHPLVPYGAVLAGGFWIRKTLELLTHGRVKGMRMRPFYLYFAVALIFAQWIVKNVLLVGWGIKIETLIL